MILTDVNISSDGSLEINTQIIDEPTNEVDLPKIAILGNDDFSLCYSLLKVIGHQDRNISISGFLLNMISSLEFYFFVSK